MNSPPSLMKLSDKLILASGSPRRRELLAALGIDFTVKVFPFEEFVPKHIAPDKAAQYLAIEKNKAHRTKMNEGIVLTADTVVIANNQILGKPETPEEAIRIIKMLSGQVHEVVTGVCISSLEKSYHFSNTTEVKFTDLDEHEIIRYVNEYSPMDKAGSYGIQEWIGMIAVEWIRGSYYNVVGLPIHEVYRILKSYFSI